MYPIVAKYESGALSRQACLEEYGLNDAVFAYWINKYRKEKRVEQGFIQIDMNQGSALMEMVCRDGQILRFYRYPPLDYLQSLFDKI